MTINYCIAGPAQSRSIQAHGTGPPIFGGPIFFFFFIFKSCKISIYTMRVQIFIYCYIGLVVGVALISALTWVQHPAGVVFLFNFLLFFLTWEDIWIWGLICSRFQVQLSSNLASNFFLLFLFKLQQGLQIVEDGSVALFTTEAKYISSVSCCTQLLWMKHQLEDYLISETNIPIYCDNIVAICLSKNPILHYIAKHIEIKHHFIRYYV